MPELWILASLVAMLANLAKVLLVKTACRDIDSWALLFAARLLPALILLPSLAWLDFNIFNPQAFWLATLGAAVITIAASLLYMEAIKQGNLSVVTPIQATVPMFMMVCTYCWYDELPPARSLLFIFLIVVSVSFVMSVSVKRKTGSGQAHPARAVLYSLFAAALFGVSTVLDRVAVSATTHGALVFSACWHAVTLLLLLPVMMLMGKRLQWRPLKNVNVAIYVVVVLLAFVAQQYAVQNSIALANGVTYVKTIVMAHLVLASAVGIYYLQEQASRAMWWANVVTAVSGVGLLWSI